MLLSFRQPKTLLWRVYDAGKELAEDASFVKYFLALKGATDSGVTL
jgi:hypothetical protein